MRRPPWLWLAAGAALVVAVGIGIGVWLTVGRASGNSNAAGCVYSTYPVQGRQHVAKLGPNFHYNSFPPTSGPHFPIPAIWNLYFEPVPEIRLVHNLEHGGVIVQYGSGVPRGTVDKIVEWYRQDPNAMIVAPLPQLGRKIAVTSWQNLAMCSGFDEKTFSDFRSQHRYKGPEHYPPSVLQPGQ
ncbi:MAG: DUF3105 domain-containing protein [Actinobacteria bacterium]|nr:MAG: DUF3105 domain-containing protein [Actinomycetota bacterium]